MINLSGIYRILCTKNNKSYIGHTTQSFGSRWKSHVKNLNSGNHHCNLLQLDWNEFGVNEFVFKILDIENDKEKALKLEQSYINGMREELYNTSLNNGFRKEVYIRNFDNTRIEIVNNKSMVIRKRNGKNFLIKKESNKKTYVSKDFDIWKWNGKSFQQLKSSDVVFAKNNFDDIELLYDFDTGFFDVKSKEEKNLLKLESFIDNLSIGDFVILKATNRHEVDAIFKIKNKSYKSVQLSNNKWVKVERIIAIDCFVDLDFWP